MIGIAPRAWQSNSRAEGFVTARGLTFTNLWDRTDAAWEHYGSPYTSRMWILDKAGNRVGTGATSFSAAQAQQIINAWE